MLAACIAAEIRVVLERGTSSFFFFWSGFDPSWVTQIDWTVEATKHRLVFTLAVKVEMGKMSC